MSSETIINNEVFEIWYSINRDKIENYLMEYLSKETISPNESEAYPFIKQYLGLNGIEVEKVEFDNQLLSVHPQYTHHDAAESNKKKFNLKGKVLIDNELPTVLFNCHIDVIPDNSSKNQFIPMKDKKYIYARGACDTKSNLICLVEAIRFLKEKNIELTKNIEIDLVIEEEITGNGTLMQIIKGVKADFIVVFEPTELKVYKGHRGVLTTRLSMYGESAHMGGNISTPNIHHQLKDIIVDIENLEKELKRNSKNETDFRKEDNPVKINIGKIQGGEWAGSTPARCDIYFNIGFVNNIAINELKDKVNNYFKKYSNIKCSFPELQNDSYIINEDNEYLQQLIRAINSEKLFQDEIYGWRVSCDAHYYYTNTGIPTVIYGCGKLCDAHSDLEKVSREDIQEEIKTLTKFLSN